ncbi:dephospho-CoA kinase [Paludibacter sp.]
MVIGITGGIGSGKSTLAKLVSKHGYMVYDTDLEARRLQNEDTNLVTQIKSLFGENIYINGELDRKSLAKIVFNNPDLLKKLTDVVHPAVKADFLCWKRNYNCEDILFMESAVLFEGGFNELTDKIILLTASMDIRIQRVMHRDNATREQVEARIKNQIPDEQKAPKSDLVINTDNGLPENVMQLIKEIRLTF